MRRRFGPISKSRKPKINTLVLMPQWWRSCQTSGAPADYLREIKFAKALSVTPKAWRDYVQEHRSADDELIVREWLEAFDKVIPSKRPAPLPEKPPGVSPSTTRPIFLTSDLSYSTSIPQWTVSAWRPWQTWWTNTFREPKVGLWGDIN